MLHRLGIRHGLCVLFGSLIVLTFLGLVFERFMLLEGNGFLSEAFSARSNPTDGEVKELYQSWNWMYSLNEDHPPFAVVPILISEKHFPLAPHLQDCTRLSEKFRKLEERNSDGLAPNWAIEVPFKRNLSPPWIRGSNEDNLAHTRYLQVRIWKHQFPSNCHSSRLSFALFKWLPSGKHGLASALHVAASQLAVAMNDGRILVPFPGTFPGANHSDCRGPHHGSVSCFFSPLTSPECEAQALTLWKGDRRGAKGRVRAVLLPESPSSSQVFRPRELLRPWGQSQLSTELLGQMARVGNGGGQQTGGKTTSVKLLKVAWWRAQAVRFILRWPSPYLCHVGNRVRQDAYGKEVARKVLESRRAQAEAVEWAKKYSPRDVGVLQEAQARSQNSSARTLESDVWWEEEPHLPRPIVSLHVSGRGAESARASPSLGSLVWMAERLRRRVPDARHVWLSADYQAALQAPREFRGWTFLSACRGVEAEGVGESPALGLASVLVASQCDHFVGGLDSPWPRLINDLRLTNGRLRAGVVAVSLEQAE